MCAKRALQRLLSEFDPSEATSELPNVPEPPGAPPGPGWESAVNQFLDWKQAEAPVGEGWIKRMRWELLRFPGLLITVGARTVAPTPVDVSLEDLMTLRARVRWEKATLELHFSALRQFLAWAGNTLATRRAAWALPAGEPTHRRWLTKNQLVALYRCSKGLGRLLVGLEGLNGLRRVEVLRLRVKDVLLDEGCLRVLGKGKNGGKWRRVPIHPRLLPILASAMEQANPEAHVVPLSRSGADVLLRKTADMAGFGRAGVKVSHHDLRRTFGRLAHSAGMDLVQLKNLYGHASLEMTVHYIGLDSDAMRAGLSKLDSVVGGLD